MLLKRSNYDEGKIITIFFVFLLLLVSFLQFLFRCQSSRWQQIRAKREIKGKNRVGKRSLRPPYTRSLQFQPSEYLCEAAQQFCEICSSLRRMPPVPSRVVLFPLLQILERIVVRIRARGPTVFSSQFFVDKRSIRRWICWNFVDVGECLSTLWLDIYDQKQFMKL